MELSYKKYTNLIFGLVFFVKIYALMYKIYFGIFSINIPNMTTYVLSIFHNLKKKYLVC